MVSIPIRSFVRAQLGSISAYLSRAYVAGPGLDDALVVLDRFARQGHGATIGYFNAKGESASDIAAADRRVVGALAGRGHSYASLKAPPMRFDPGLIGGIARQAAQVGVGVHFDSHAIDTSEPTFAAIETALRFTPEVGCTLPGRWPRSLTDVERADDLKLRVRVVKGQWADPAHPEIDLRAGYMDVIERLAGRRSAVAVATHDPALVRAALRRLLDAGTPCELEQLFGLPMRASTAIAVAMGVPVRVYIPFGEAWLPYALTELARRPGRLLWILKDALAATVDR